MRLVVPNLEDLFAGYGISSDDDLAVLHDMDRSARYNLLKEFARWCERKHTVLENFHVVTLSTLLEAVYQGDNRIRPRRRDGATHPTLREFFEYSGSAVCVVLPQLPVLFSEFGISTDRDLSVLYYLGKYDRNHVLNEFVQWCCRFHGTSITEYQLAVLSHTLISLFESRLPPALSRSCAEQGGC